jgi:hypothetical protein
MAFNYWHYSCAGISCQKKIRGIGRLDPKETVSLQELAYSNMMVQESLLRLLKRKHVITEKEFMDELKALKKEMAAKQGE